MAHVDEHEREPVPARALKGPGKFWALFAGEHVAGTEFMLGPLFLVHGVRAADLFVGLLVGNVLAVLMWRYLCAPFATRVRLTLYYQLERVAGRGFVLLYNLANGLLFCVLAGAMVTVSATAVGSPFGMRMPTLADTLPNSVTWVVVVAAVGATIALVAAGGYDRVARFSSRAAPWMILVFLACGLIALADLGVRSPAGFWRAATTEIWPGGAPLAEPRFTLWHVIFFAWLCNAPWHLGLSDMTLFRYARKPGYGWAAAAGMFIGHYMAWVAASLLLALQLKNSPVAPGEVPTVAPGPLAWQVAGVAGVACVVIAGWTTANPTIYRAGLALQGLWPRSPTFAVTLVAGGLATVAGLFPAVAMKLLDFVGFFGTAIAPVGAILLADWWFAGRLGFPRDWAAAAGRFLNWPAAVAWLLVLAAASLVIVRGGVFGSFVAFPAWLATGLLYLVLSRLCHRQPARP